MAKTKLMQKRLGVAVPLGALYSRENAAIGEYPDLKPLADFCKLSGISVIQLLPVNDTGTQSSPYSGLSAFALHPIYIRIPDVPDFHAQYESNSKLKKLYDDFTAKHKYTPRYDYERILNEKTAILSLIYDSTEEGMTGKPGEKLAKFIKANPWVKTYAVYKNLKRNYMQASWKTWLESDRRKTDDEIAVLWNKMAFKKEHLFFAWLQMIAAEQFSDAVAYAHDKEILLKGDMPILMNEDSCDAWAYPQFFNQDLRAGSPADGENPCGQNWGFPTYNWKNLKADGYSWWKNRLICAAKYYDAYRLDHILGFFRIWAIPEADCNALTGHAEPCATIKRDDLYERGFDDQRIRWLSQPHIPTSLIEDITWNHEAACKILEKFCKKLDGEELWLFAPSTKGSAQIARADFCGLCTDEAAVRIKDALIKKWSDRTLLEIAKNKFIPLWTYGSSTSWQSLAQSEKDSLSELFEQTGKKEERLWKKQADEIFDALTSATKMISCGEDLGAGIACLPQTMKEHGILGLRVLRWCRRWEKEAQPYVAFSEYEPLSVITTSVHDSSTMRAWWDEEKESVRAFVQENPEIFGAQKDDAQKVSQAAFAPEIAAAIIRACAKSQSVWFIPPLQDLLYMDKKYWLENPQDERINVPGTVSAFNWTYRLPCPLEDLIADTKLQKNIMKAGELR